MSPAKDNGYKRQEDTTQSNLANVENSICMKDNTCKLLIWQKFLWWRFVFTHQEVSETRKKRHLQWATFAAQTLVCPLFQKETISSRISRQKLQSLSLLLAQLMDI